jgi:hypothetical protein
MTTRYKFSFTAGSLLLNETIKVAEVYVKTGNWEKTREHVMHTNLLQKNTESAASRFYLESQRRLKTLSTEELSLLVEARLEEQKQIVFLAICRYYGFIRDFVTQILRENVLTMRRTFRDSDYYRFSEEVSIEHPEYEALRESTKKKVRQVLLNLLREVGILSSGPERKITPVQVSSEVCRLIASKNPKELRYFLYTDQQIKEVVEQYG